MDILLEAEIEGSKIRLNDQDIQEEIDTFMFEVCILYISHTSFLSFPFETRAMIQQLQQYLGFYIAWQLTPFAKYSALE